MSAGGRGGGQHGGSGDHGGPGNGGGPNGADHGGGFMGGGVQVRPQWAANRGYPVTTMPGFPQAMTAQPPVAPGNPMTAFPQVGMGQPGAVPNHSLPLNYQSLFPQLGIGNGPQMGGNLAARYARALG